MADRLSKSFSPVELEQEEEEGHQKIYQHFTQLVTALPTIDAGSIRPYHFYDGWYGSLPAVVGTMAAQKYFKARPTDVLLATMPKSGTTWIKALLFATINRQPELGSRHALESYSPHKCIPTLEYQIYTNNQVPDLSQLPAPRLFATHIPFHSLPASVVDAGCRIVCLCRNPRDNFISSWHFFNSIRARNKVEPQSLEEALDQFCKGISMMGPYWDHVLGYWKAHQEMTQRVLFMKYEELKEEPAAQLRRLAEFVGCPFSEEEEKEEVVDGILRMCAIESLSNFEVNRVGETKFGPITVENSAFFRRGTVGDWKNHLTPEMVDRLEKITEEKLRGSGLTF